MPRSPKAMRTSRASFSITTPTGTSSRLRSWTLRRGSPRRAGSNLRRSDEMAFLTRTDPTRNIDRFYVLHVMPSFRPEEDQLERRQPEGAAVASGYSSVIQRGQTICGGAPNEDRY